MPWTEERVVADGDVWFSALGAAIDDARVSIDMETYILAPDAVGRDIVARLIRAARRGVAVRLLVDGVGAAAWLQQDGAREGAGLGAMAVRVWNPLPWMLVQPAALPGPRWSDVARFLLALNRRDHRKLTLIDGDTAWVGSFNLEGRSCAFCAGEAAWRDTGAIVRGPGLVALARAFDHAWRRGWRLTAGRMRPRPRLPRIERGRIAHSVRLNHLAMLRRSMYRDLLARIRNARGRLWITNAYFVPKGSLVRALAAAAQAGADVRILVPGASDVAFMPWTAATFYGALLKAGARVYEYRPTMMHAKTILFDDCAFVGSHNLNHRSLVQDLEVEVVLRQPLSLQRLEQQFLADCTRARRITAPVWRGRPRWQRLAGRLSLLVKEWL